jgi:hypothetical protein
VGGAGTSLIVTVIGVCVPVNWPAPVKVRPVMKAVALSGSGPTPVSIPTRKRSTPPSKAKTSAVPVVGEPQAAGRVESKMS